MIDNKLASYIFLHTITTVRTNGMRFLCVTTFMPFFLDSWITGRCQQAEFNWIEWSFAMCSESERMHRQMQFNEQKLRKQWQSHLYSLLLLNYSQVKWTKWALESSVLHLQAPKTSMAKTQTQCRTINIITIFQVATSVIHFHQLQVAHSCTARVCVMTSMAC